MPEQRNGAGEGRQDLPAGRREMPGRAGGVGRKGRVAAMRGVGGVGKGGAAGNARGVARAATGGFTVGAGATASGPATERTGACSAAAAVGMSLLAVQEGGARSERDAAAGRRARSLLRELQGLQTELLGGRADPARLRRLAALESGEEGADPGLRDAVRAVALRARIELERRGGAANAERSAAVP